MRPIDADALMDEIKNRCIMPDWCKTLVRSVVLSLPTIEPKKGKWMTSYLEHEAVGIRPKLLYCSECCQCIAYSTKFCPNCGAKMK